MAINVLVLVCVCVCVATTDMRETAALPPTTTCGVRDREKERRSTCRIICAKCEICELVSPFAKN